MFGVKLRKLLRRKKTNSGSDVPKPQHIISLELCRTASGDPVVIAKERSGTVYRFYIHTAWEIHRCNAFLRQMAPGMEIQFTTYSEYAKMLERVFETYKDVT